MEYKPKLVVPASLENENPYGYALYLLIDWYARHTEAEDFLINAEMLAYKLYGDPTKNLDEINEELEEFAANGRINKLKKKHYVAHKDSFVKLHERFIMIYEEDFWKVVNSKSHAKYSILLYYLRLLDSFDVRIEVNGERGVIGYMPYSFFNRNYGYSNKALILYNRTLENLGVLFVFRQGYSPVTDEFRNNYYSRLCDKSKLLKYLNKVAYNPEGINAANFERSVKQRHNAALAGKVYSADDILKLNEQIHFYNEEDDNVPLTKLKLDDKLLS